MRMLRHKLARGFIHLGLAIMPEGSYKTRLREVLWDFRREVQDTISRDTSRHRQHTTKYEDLCQ
jgi:hypothetical protein